MGAPGGWTTARPSSGGLSSVLFDGIGARRRDGSAS
jgi:hypothetical protein